MRRRALHLRPSLRQLLDPGNALQHMPAPQQALTTPGMNLPDFSFLNTRHSPLDLQETLPSSAAPQTTLDDTVIEGLIQALFTALPEGLEAAAVETTNSGNRIGRHGHVSRLKRESLWVPTSVPKPDTQEEEPEEEEAQTLPPPQPPEPRAYVVGAVPDGLFQVTLRSLPALEVSLPSENAGSPLATQVALGSGEACFLRAQSALWTWRTHRQANQEMHAEGPPMLGRNALIEQRIGPVTLLLGCRVTDMIEAERQWGFTLGSLAGQVLQSRESFLIEWQPDDQVIFSLHTQHQFAMPNLTFLGPVYSALRRKFKQGYIRNMQELTSD